MGVGGNAEQFWHATLSSDFCVEHLNTKLKKTLRARGSIKTLSTAGEQFLATAQCLVLKHIASSSLS